ncbi:large conductance mechanosensitive channel protein MscL [Psychrobacillus psychrodurans]|uniref:large conductance mechanosensitive channel protein MscL n=1 Tax=Psychrobacillus psychrodurans TaxID=126157 RepID=UPI0008EC2FDC|nr:large conductance mechanosensitive channel protein MscL [Psychrobacillus psychrodurans]MCZ8539806.1 large conductance mechanosensitive channel protein MscL [Psychrobacillus psychrodurans]SFM92236.1 large conductance mechanosensitive channel [Psychrobacillus psychrodurans]
MWKDFKEFAFKGNVLDLAVAVVIGAAFGKIVSSLVENIITPLVGLLLNGIKFTSLSFKYKETEILYGNFIQSVFDFLVIAFSIFIFIRLLSKFKRKEDVAAVTENAPPVDSKEVLLEEIRDLLKKQNNA